MYRNTILYKKKKKTYTRIKVQLIQIYYKTKDFNVTLYRTSKNNNKFVKIL